MLVRLWVATYVVLSVVLWTGVIVTLARVH